MSENKHTPEPWRAFNNGQGVVGVSTDRSDVCWTRIEEGGWLDSNRTIDTDYENARRIVACVNACAGIPTDMLEAMPSGPASLLPMYARLEKQRDELLSDLAEAKRSAEFNFEQYQDVGRLLHEECEKTEKLLAAMIHIQQVACSGSPELGIAIDAIASVKGKQCCTSRHFKSSAS